MEDDAREDAADRVWQDDVPDGLPACGTDIPAGLAELARYGGEGLLGGGDDDGRDVKTELVGNSLHAIVNLCGFGRRVVWQANS